MVEQLVAQECIVQQIVLYHSSRVQHCAAGQNFGLPIPHVVVQTVVVQVDVPVPQFHKPTLEVVRFAGRRTVGGVRRGGKVASLNRRANLEDSKNVRIQNMPFR